MIKKGIFLLAGIFILIIFGNAIISGAVCCEKLKGTDLWCQGAVDKSLCDSKYSSWLYKVSVLESCLDVPDCLGTCVNAKTGECSQYTDKMQCKESGGTWNESLPEEIDACKEVCCLLGQDAYFINPTACNAMFTQFGIKGNMRTDITSRADCEALRTGVEVGACIISTLTENTCRTLPGTECTPNNLNVLSGYLQNNVAINQINVEFKKGLLCTASENGKPISNCAPSTNTECKDNQVYFKDLCGNIANIYDARMFSENTNSWTSAMRDYWTYMKDPYYSSDICNVTSSGSNTCGNCDPSDNTVCKSYKETSLSKPDNNANGLVCGDLSCSYKDPTSGVTTKYQHGDSWCSGSASTFDIIFNLTTSEISKSNITALKNASKYNLPGSRYYKLVCSYGEVLVEECGDYRNGVCMEGRREDGTSQASCVFNNYRTCTQVDTKTQCESNNSLCKWIPGYRWDGKIAPENQRKETQGSCVPLIAPGFDFWKGTSQGNGICGMATVQDAALFETGIFVSRNNFASWSDKTHSNRCINGCYTIPGYALQFTFNGTKVYPEDVVCSSGGNYGIAGCPNTYSVLTEFYDESEFKLAASVGSYSLSDRRGQYCHKDGRPDQWLTGSVTGKSYDCTPGIGSESKDERKERDYPIYLTNQEWIMGITDRLRSLGDCGYKANTIGKYSAPETEMITAIFQKMTQKGTVKKNITVEQILYKGGKYLTGDLQKYETVLSTTPKSYSCNPSYNGICTSTINNPSVCEGGTVQEPAEGETLCAENMVCCVYPELS